MTTRVFDLLALERQFRTFDAVELAAEAAYWDGLTDEEVDVVTADWQEVELRPTPDAMTLVWRDGHLQPLDAPPWFRVLYMTGWF